ncbi:MAG: sigma-70 family RNA polymerase sigma factor [Chlorobi bacterium]|nr:sigma-70 family RNA polymerase sigma factor [Chlorobiota bacterium]
MHDNYKEFLIKFIKHDKSVIEPFIALHFNLLANFVKKFGGSKQDAEDLMQDALYVLYKILKFKKKVILEKNIDEYFRGIYRNIWYYRFRKIENDKNEIKTIKYDKLESQLSGTLLVDNNAIDEIKREERYKLYRKHLLKLGKNCQKVLKMTQLGLSNKAMAEIMDYSMDYLYKKKTLCKKNLIESIKNDPYYENYI